ncbi:MAG: cysteine desulfurase [Candidatus Thorarchaeota archaeon]|nr:MAG: cysteine desulfurase [Candidatus Thorarchaeota archaeon]
MAYFDHANSSPVDERVIQAMLPYFREFYGTAGLELGHSKDIAALTGLEEARKTVAKSLNADPRAIVFTSGVTESNNMAIRGVAVANKGSGRHIITTPIETQSVLQSCKRLEGAGYEISMLDVDEYGLIDLNQLKKTIRDDTILISVQHANGEIGTIQPVEEIAEIAVKKDIMFHTDATHTYMRVPIDTESFKANLISFDAHRIHGPKGIGVLYIRRKTRIHRVLEGGDEERRLRPGIENIPAAVGMAKAIEIWEPNENEHVLNLRKYLEKKLKESLTGFTITGHPENRAPHIFSMVVDHVEGESMLVHLDMLGYSISTGSACSSKTLRGSHVLRAIGLPPEVSHGSVRVSFSRYNTETEIDGFVEELCGTVERLREFSPLTSGVYFANEEEDNHHHDLPEDDW